jgi:hypothetical protein
VKTPKNGLIAFVAIVTLGFMSTACGLFGGKTTIIECAETSTHPDCVEDSAQKDNAAGEDNKATAGTQAPAKSQAPANNTRATSGTGQLPPLPLDMSHDGWTIKANADIGRDPIVRDWLKRLKAPAPSLWPTAPNVPNRLVPSFRVVPCKDLPGSAGVDPSLKCVPDGLEYTGDWNTPFCQQDARCDFIIPAREFRYVAGDYGFFDINHCTGEKGVGFQLWIYNVGGESVNFRDQCADNGGTRHGRYWNGDTLEIGVWAGVSHEVANMLNLNTNSSPTQMLNSPGGANAGANCGNPDACQKVDVMVVVVAGDRVLATAHTVVSR